VRPITAGKCSCDRYTASTKVRTETRTRDTGRAQDRHGGGRGGSRHPRRPRPQGPLRLKHVADIIKRRRPWPLLKTNYLLRNFKINKWNKFQSHGALAGGHCVTMCFTVVSWPTVRIVDLPSQLSFLPRHACWWHVWPRRLMTVATCSVPPCSVILRKDSVGLVVLLLHE